jgi:NADPH-dependent 2,4-dienoyl-CoA reductase/sulfur reductase-like enzyme/nitrite reductase/ring-hydroxylating ferredoxin subunit
MAHPAQLTGLDLTVGLAMADLAENVPVLGHAQGEAIVLIRTGADVRALGATCSHYGGPLAEGLVVGETLRCPWHHACFDLRTGDAVGAPALNPIASYEVQRSGDRVILGPKKSRSSPPAAAAEDPLQQLSSLGRELPGRGCGRSGSDIWGYAGLITLIGNEASGPVDRPNLSKDYLAGTAPEEWVPLRTRKFYNKINVDLILDETAVELSPTRKTVVLERGRTLSYDALLLATGAQPMRLPIPGSKLLHVFTLRTLADARGIIEAARTARRAVVIGSSFIGLEVAASLRARNLEVDVVSQDRLPLERVLGARLGQFVQELHQGHGVRFHLASSIRAIHPHAVELDNGDMLAADLVVLGVGVRPRTGLADKAGLEVADGIIVDSYLRTSAPGVWAAGDVARYPELRMRRTGRIEHGVVAERHGQAVARDMLGLGAPFRDVPFFWSQHYDATLAYVGHADSEDAIEVMGSLPRRNATVVYRHAGRVSAVVTIGRDRQSLAIEAAFEQDDGAAVEALLEAEDAGESRGGVALNVDARSPG